MATIISNCVTFFGYAVVIINLFFILKLFILLAIDYFKSTKS